MSKDIPNCPFNSCNKCDDSNQYMSFNKAYKDELLEKYRKISSKKDENFVFCFLVNCSYSPGEETAKKLFQKLLKMIQTSSFSTEI